MGVIDSFQVEVTEQPLRVDGVLSGLVCHGQGAQVLFAGAVRDWNHGRRVIAVSYDAFVPLAQATLKRICHEAQERWGTDLHLCVRHRVGRLSVGEVSVVIAVTSVHRDEAYQASRYVIEELKERVPIWKKEHYEDGETAWLKGHALCSHRGGHSSGRDVLPNGRQQGSTHP